MREKEDVTMEERVKELDNRIQFLENLVVEQAQKISVLALYVANTPCCTPDKYAQLSGLRGAVGITEPNFIREARRNANGGCC